MAKHNKHLVEGSEASEFAEKVAQVAEPVASEVAEKLEKVSDDEVCLKSLSANKLFLLELRFDPGQKLVVNKKYLDETVIKRALELRLIKKVS